ncbi:DUF488 domain-containing protein [Glycomyces buryatensis]|uniref:DUF488 family protein n=1 Tax=Glycomyces buryatensis TaxID=2570927 RepID=A0A4S8QBI0_9ACTN|nr:DUF488 family protein [Glycomyces buryatensis]THV41893.1 DUF488 family protein [Glycomyces buryatensis]
MADFTIERVYDYRQEAPPAGAVFMVDRLWPRGVSKEDVAGAEWLPDAAPSPNLRIWFGHRPERFEEFAQRYRSELDGHPERTEPILTAAAAGPVTLLYAAKDPRINHALVLKNWCEENLTS